MSPEAERAKEAVQELVTRMNPDAVPDLPWYAELALHNVKAFPFIWTLILLMFLDVLTGYIAAALANEIDSNLSYKGALKKAQMLLMVAAGMVFELLYPDVPWGRLIAGLLSLGEMVSIVENAGKAGLPIPAQLKETLKRLRSAEKDDRPGAQVHLDIHTDRVIVPDAKTPEVSSDGKTKKEGNQP